MADALQMVSVPLPADPAVLRGTASVLERAGAWRSLANLLDAWQPLEPENLQLRVRQYGAWRGAGDEERAERCIRSAVEEAAGDRKTILRLCRLLRGRGHDDAVALLLGESLRCMPGDWQLAMEYAREMDARNDPDAAALALLSAYTHPAHTVPARAAMLRRLLADGRRDDARNAIAALFSDAQPDTRRISNARRAVIEQMLAAGENDLADGALAAYAANAPTALATYLASQQALSFEAGLRASLDRIRDSGADTLPFELAILRALEFAGRHDDADQLHCALESRRVVEAEPSEASPTPSTMMFRNGPLLKVLVAAIGWFADHRDIVRVHVAACSSGEEAYSLALALHQADLLNRCGLSASDVDPGLIRRALTGVIDQKAMQAVPEASLALFERRHDGHFVLTPAIHGRIRFSVQDLSQEADNGEAAYDVLIANNVLVHFPRDPRRRMIGHIVGRVSADGLLCLGGSRQDDLQSEIRTLGLVPIVSGSAQIFDAWHIQRNGWYVNPRPYWALPPARLTVTCPWKHAALFARSAETAVALEAVVADAVNADPAGSRGAAA